MAVALISISIVAGVDAKPRPLQSPRDVCKAGQICKCSNDTEFQMATCCTQDASGFVNCEQCNVDTNTGNYVDCRVYGGKQLDYSKTHANPPSSGALGSKQPNPGNGLLIFNPPNNAKAFVNSNNSSKK